MRHSLDVEGHAKGEHVLDKVHSSKSLASLLTMAVDNVSDHTCGTELDAKVDKTHADHHGYRPRLLCVS